jgi:hypothetical protein
MFTVQLTGIAEMTQRLQRLAQPPTRVLGEALYEEGNRIMGESVRLVPIDTGLLRSTSHVERPVQEGPITSVELSYGSNGVAPYAMVVEFRLDVHHPQGQAHYLQQPFFAATAGFTERIADHLRGTLTM